MTKGMARDPEASPWGGPKKTRILKNIRQSTSTVLVTTASLLLISANLLTREYFGGVSGTLILSLLALVSGIVLSSVDMLEQGIRSFFFGSVWRTLAFSSLGLIVVMSTTHLLFRPSWNGAQMLVSVCAFSLIMLSTSGTKSAPMENRVMPFVLLGVIVAASIHILSFLLGLEYDFGGRSRGQTFVISAAVIPLLTRHRWIGTFTFLLLLVAIVLTDSRAATATAVLLASPIVLSFWCHKSRRLKLFWAILAPWLAGITAAALQAATNRRPSFTSPPPLLEAPGASSPQEIVERAAVVNAWSQGRTKFWGELLASLENSHDWLFGRGNGFSSDLSSTFWGVEHPHNTYLQYLADTGLIGLGLLVVLFAATFMAAAGQLTRRDEAGPWTAFGVLWVLLSQSLVTNTLVYPHFFIPLALFLGLALRTR